ncbi:MazG-like family protein [Nakamurella aerolata]|uniref:Nucleotide pyrophosphohydrolase n=1 Tax=Nakamurella aerolata TaxID=1656892 RepID=A0A849AK34_9ACTN|nr:nucleotide pyrophosphohydrolase [Nakamurella aerolata]
MSDLEKLSASIHEFVEDRDWGQFHDPKSLLIALTGEVGEVAELLQWLPADRAAELVRDAPLSGQIRDELADVLIYLIQLAEACGVELVAAATAKLRAAIDRYPASEHRGVAPNRPS